MSTSPSRSRSRKSSIWARAIPAAPPRNGWSMRRWARSGSRISATGNCRRSPAASSNARILPACWCSSPAAKQQHGPGLLLLDEPTSSLDMRHQIDLVETARGRAQNGTAVIAVLHDLNLAMRFADRIVLLHRGKLAVDGGRARGDHGRDHPPDFRGRRHDRLYRSAACRSCCRRPCGPQARQRHNAAALIQRRYRFFTELSANCNSRSARHSASSS